MTTKSTVPNTTPRRCMKAWRNGELTNDLSGLRAAAEAGDCNAAARLNMLQSLNAKKEDDNK